MKGFSVSTSLAAASLLATTILAQTVDPIVIKGQHMFYKTNGSQFFIQGVAYQRISSLTTRKVQLTNSSQRMPVEMAPPQTIPPTPIPSQTPIDASKTFLFSKS